MGFESQKMRFITIYYHINRDNFIGDLQHGARWNRLIWIKAVNLSIVKSLM